MKPVARTRVIMSRVTEPLFHNTLFQGKLECSFKILVGKVSS